MCDDCKKCREELEEELFPYFVLNFRPVTELAKDMVEILINRQDACNEFIAAAANALSECPEDAEAIISETKEVLVLLQEVDEKVIDLLEFVNDEECECVTCICQGCPYGSECGGDCYFEDEDFFANPKEENIAEE